MNQISIPKSISICDFFLFLRILILVYLLYFVELFICRFFGFNKNK